MVAIVARSERGRNGEEGGAGGRGGMAKESTGSKRRVWGAEVAGNRVSEMLGRGHAGGSQGRESHEALEQGASEVRGESSFYGCN